MSGDPFAAPEVQSALAKVWDSMPSAERERFEPLIDELATGLASVDEKRFYSEMTRIGQEIIDGAAAILPEASSDQRELIFARTIALAEKIKARIKEIRARGTA